MRVYEQFEKANRRATIWFLAWSATAGAWLGTMIAVIAVAI